MVRAFHSTINASTDDVRKNVVKLPTHHELTHFCQQPGLISRSICLYIPGQNPLHWLSLIHKENPKLQRLQAPSYSVERSKSNLILLSPLHDRCSVLRKQQPLSCASFLFRCWPLTLSMIISLTTPQASLYADFEILSPFLMS